MHSYIRPNTHIALRLPSGIVKIVEIKPNTTINIGKFGTFSANLLLGRPYYLTYELLDKDDGKASTTLRIVPASELHAEALGNEYAPAEAREEAAGEVGTANGGDGGQQFDIVGEDGAVIMRSNRLTVDDPSRQTLSMAEIEELKKAGTGSGKEIIAKIMASHLAIDEKTSFSLAKYTLRKSKKYLRRFTVFPLDVGTLADYVIEKESFKIMDLREEGLGLINAWANVHSGEDSRIVFGEDGVSQVGGGRWLVVDDTGGLVVAALAEKMGILYPEEENDESGEEHEEDEEEEEEEKEPEQQQEPAPTDPNAPDADTTMPDAPAEPTSTSTSTDSSRIRRTPKQHTPQMSARTTTLTVIHSNSQPNLSYLTYFSFDSGAPNPSHPLYTHLKSLSWLQLLQPTLDPSYIEPELIPDAQLAALKSSKRGNYYKKRRRWEKTTRVVDEARRGGYDGLVVASSMDVKGVLRSLVPLVRGGGKVVVYSANAEPLVELCDFYSKERRAAFVARQVAAAEAAAGAGAANGAATPDSPSTADKTEEEAEVDSEAQAGQNGTTEQVETSTPAPTIPSAVDEDEDEDFPVNPTLLLAPTLQTARARHWQVLPQRTHPFMTSRGGAEGYLFTATRVVPAEGKVEARGKFRGKAKKRKTGAETAVAA